MPAKTVVIDCGLSGREFGVGLNHGVPHKIQNAMPSNDRACSRADRGEQSVKIMFLQQNVPYNRSSASFLCLLLCASYAEL